jgi:hypothetical protein
MKEQKGFAGSVADMIHFHIRIFSGGAENRFANSRPGAKKQQVSNKAGHLWQSLYHEGCRYTRQAEPETLVGSLLNSLNFR